MPNFLHNLGLDLFASDEDTFMKTAGYVCKEGKAIVGYYGLPYFNLHFGWAQLIDRTLRTSDGRLEFDGFDTHSSGFYVWKVRIIDDVSNTENEGLLSKKLLVKTQEGHSLAMLHVLNADVLPSYAEDEIISLQMIAFPISIAYFKDAAAYEESVKPTENGQKFFIEANTLFPVGLLSAECESTDKEITQIRGTVKRLLKGEVKLGEEKLYPYIDCIVETQFGDIEIVHTYEDVDESQRENIRVGAEMNCFAVLCGDAAIYQYENGIVTDFDNDLRLLAYSLGRGDPERLRNALSDHFVYRSEASGRNITDKDALISFIKTIKDKSDPCHVHFATVSEDSDVPESDYPAGTRCLALSYGESKDYSAIAFIDIDSNGLIEKILISKDARYRFKVDSPLPDPVSADAEDFDISYQQAMLNRAHFFKTLPDDIDMKEIEDCIAEHDDMFSNAVHSLSVQKPSESLFGEAFLIGCKQRSIVSLDENTVRSLGSRFFNDFNFINGDSYTVQELETALIFTEALGYMYKGINS